MKRNTPITAMFGGFIVMLITVLGYFLIFDSIFDVEIRWVSLLCILAVELLGTVKTLCFGKNVMGIAHTTGGLIHLLVALGLALVYVGLGSSNVKAYLLWNGIVLAVAILVDALLLRANRTNEAGNQKRSNAVAALEENHSKAQQLSLEFGDTGYKKEIDSIIEGLKYSNRVDLYGNEGDMLIALDELKVLLRADEGAGVTAKVKEILNMIELRNRGLKRSGKY